MKPRYGMVLAAALALPAFAQLGQTPFGTPLAPMANVNPATGTNGSNGIAKLDCNGDGIPDLVTSNREGSISIFVGNADTTYQAPLKMSLGAGISPQGIAAGDINGDNKPDLVVTASPPNAIYPLLGNGSCGFAIQTGIAGVGAPYSISLTDVNGDGKNDIVVSDAASNKINVLLGNGVGGFGNPIASIIGANPYLFAVVDLNGDGKPDVAAVDPNANGIWVGIGNGLGNFVSPQFLATGQNPQAPAAGDMNGDGKPDLAVANGGSNTVSLFLNNFSTAGGALSFLSPFTINLPPGTGPGGPVLTTTPGTDKQDQLVVPGFNANNVIIYNYLSPSLYQDPLLGLPFNPASTVIPVGFDPIVVVPIPGPGLAAPGNTGLNVVSPNCPVDVSPSTLPFGPNPPALIPGLEVEVNVPPGCPWTSTVTFNGQPVTIASVTPASGVGPATVLVQMQPNPAVDARGARITFISGASSKFTFAFQSGNQSACTDAAVNKKSFSVVPAGGTGSINVTVPVTSDGCNSSAASSNPAVGVNPTTIPGSANPTPVIFTIPANPGDTTNFYGFIGPNLISINSKGGCVPVIGSFNGSVPSSGATFTIPVTIPGGCTLTPKAAGLGATASVVPSGVQVTVPATTATSPLTGTVTIGSQVAHLVQKPPNPTQLFTDVPLTHPMVDWITMLRKLNITNGCGTNIFCPEDTVLRYQMATFIVRAVESGDNFPFNPIPYFADVPASHPSFKHIQRLKDLGITAGCGGNNFCPNDAVTRGSMAVFLVRARLGVVAGTPIAFTGDQYFTDEPASDPSVPFVQQQYPLIQQFKALGITSGCSTTTYCPNDPVTRGQAATFLIRSFATPFAAQ